jgi:hypothetical protein
MTDSLTQAAGTIRGVLDDLSGLPVTASRAERTAAILDRLATELAEAAALLRKAAEEPAYPQAGRAPRRPAGVMMGDTA